MVHIDSYSGNFNYLNSKDPLSSDHLATLRQLAIRDKRKSLSEVVQVLIEREAERLLKESCSVC